MAGIDEFLAKRKAGGALPGDPRRLDMEDDVPQHYNNYLTGAIGSFASAIPEMIGFDARPEAAEFRERNPVSGFLTQALPYLAGGIGSEAIAGTKAAAAGIEGVLASMGLGAEQAATRPVLRNAMKYGVLGQVPFEAGRALVGTAVAPSENIGDLWASSAMGLALGGVTTGGLSMLLKSGGKKVGKGAVGELLGGNMELSPTFMRRQAAELGPDEAKWNAGSHEDNMDYLTKAGIDEEPVLNEAIPEAGWRDYTGEMQKDISEEGWKDLNSLFKVNKGANSKGIDVRSWWEGSATDTTKLIPGEREGLLKAAGFDDLGDLVNNVRYPRVATVDSEAGAAHMNELLSKTGGLEHVDGSWIGYNKDDVGVFAKRISQGQKVGEAEAKRFGRHGIKIGDKFLVGLTDKTGRLAPNAERFADRVIGRQSKVSRAWREGVKNDFFAKQDDKVIGLYGDEALDDVGKMSEAGWIEKHAKPLGERLGKDFSVGEQAHMLYRQVVDAVQPTLGKLPKNKQYARLYGLLKGRDALKNSRLSEMIHGKIEGWKKGGFLSKAPIHSDMGLYGVKNPRAGLDTLTDAEAHFVQEASDSFVKPEDLKDFVPDEVYSPAMQKYADERVVDDQGYVRDFMPTFEKNDAAKFNFEEGYMHPTLVHGPFHATIMAEGGKHPIWNVAGNSAGEVNAKVGEILKQAKDSGKLWTGEKARIVAMDKPGALQDVMERLQKQLANAANKDVLGIVQKAMKNYNAEQYRSLLSPGKKGGSALSKRGTNKIAAGEGKMYSKGEILANLERHRKDLMSFQADYGFRQRYAGPLTRLQQHDDVMYKDLQHKMGQFAGLQGPTAKFINENVSKLLGPSMGPNAATTIANTTNKMMYLWNLGIVNPTAAVVNMLTPITVLPALIARISRMDPEQFRNIVQVAPRLNAEGKVTGINHLIDPVRVTKKSIRDWIRPSAGQMENVTRAVEEGALSAQLVDEAMGTKSKLGATMNEIYQAKGLWHAAEHGLTWMSRKSEEFSKGVMFMAGDNMGRMMGLEGEALYQASVSMMEMGAYGYKQTQRAKMITGPIGSVMGLFKNFQMHYIDDMLTYIGMAAKGEGFSPLLWQQASTLAIGGLGVSPLVILANGMARWESDSPNSYAWMKKNFASEGDDGHYAADNVYYGLGGVLGFSLNSSLVMPGTDVANDVASFGNIVLLERMKALGAAVGEGWDYYENTGQNPLSNDNLRDAFFNASMPRAMIRAMAVTEGQFIKTMKTGLPSQRDVYGEPISVGTRVMYGLGITPVGVASHQMVQKEAWRATESRREAINMFGQMLADANLNHDTEGMTQANHSAMLANVPLSSVNKSAQTIINRERRGDNLSRYDKRLVMGLEGD